MKHLEGETIAAIATPIGAGGLGVVRISGPLSKQVLKTIFKPISSNGSIEPRKATIGWIVDNHGDKYDKAMATYMQAPNSYTGEDIIEISCHGSPKLLREVLDLTIEAGARLAERGEFTKRALLNGKMDLAQAEAIADLIGARTRESLRSAARQMEGGLSREISELKSKTMELLSEIEASIDFPDEISDVPRGKQGSAINGLIKGTEKLLSTAEQGRLYREGLKVAIAGKANVGKSSLLNAMLREERAIVTDAPGTTRDTIEEGVNIGGIPVNLIDTAGMRKTKNMAEKLGVERTGKAIDNADIIIIVVDSSEKLAREDKAIISRTKDRTRIVALNKSDLKERTGPADIKKAFGDTIKTIRTSAKYNKGIKELERSIYNTAVKGCAGANMSVTINSRHKECLIRAKEALIRSLESVKNSMSADFVSIDLKAAASSLGEITGEEVSEEVIRSIFERFCVGK